MAGTRQLRAGELLDDVVDHLVPHTLLRHVLVVVGGRFGVGQHAIGTSQEAEHVRRQPRRHVERKDGPDIQKDVCPLFSFDNFRYLSPIPFENVTYLSPISFACL